MKRQKFPRSQRKERKEFSFVGDQKYQIEKERESSTKNCISRNIILNVKSKETCNCFEGSILLLKQLYEARLIRSSENFVCTGPEAFLFFRNSFSSTQTNEAEVSDRLCFRKCSIAHQLMRPEESEIFFYFLKCIYIQLWT